MVPVGKWARAHWTRISGRALRLGHEPDRSPARTAILRTIPVSRPDSKALPSAPSTNRSWRISTVRSRLQLLRRGFLQRSGVIPQMGGLRGPLPLNPIERLDPSRPIAGIDEAGRHGAEFVVGHTAGLADHLAEAEVGRLKLGCKGSQGAQALLQHGFVLQPSLRFQCSLLCRTAYRDEHTSRSQAAEASTALLSEAVARGGALSPILGPAYLEPAGALLLAYPPEVAVDPGIGPEKGNGVQFIG